MKTNRFFARLYLDRAAGRHCHHRYSGGDAPPRLGPGQGEGQGDRLPEQSQAMGLGDFISTRTTTMIASHAEGSFLSREYVHRLTLGMSSFHCNLKAAAILRYALAHRSRTPPSETPFRSVPATRAAPRSNGKKLFHYCLNENFIDGTGKSDTSDENEHLLPNPTAVGLVI